MMGYAESMRFSGVRLRTKRLLWQISDLTTVSHPPTMQLERVTPSQNSGELARMIMNRVDKLISFDMKIKGRTLLDIIELYITRSNHANDSISFAHI